MTAELWPSPPTRTRHRAPPPPWPPPPPPSACPPPPRTAASLSAFALSIASCASAAALSAALARDAEASRAANAVAACSSAASASARDACTAASFSSVAARPLEGVGRAKDSAAAARADALSRNEIARAGLLLRLRRLGVRLADGSELLLVRGADRLNLLRVRCLRLPCGLQRGRLGVARSLEDSSRAARAAAASSCAAEASAFACSTAATFSIAAACGFAAASAAACSALAALTPRRVTHRPSLRGLLPRPLGAGARVRQLALRLIEHLRRPPHLTLERPRLPCGRVALRRRLGRLASCAAFMSDASRAPTPSPPRPWRAAPAASRRPSPPRPAPPPASASAIALASAASSLLRPPRPPPRRPPRPPPPPSAPTWRRLRLLFERLLRPLELVLRELRARRRAQSHAPPRSGCPPRAPPSCSRS